MVTGVFDRVTDTPSSVEEDFISTFSPGTATGPPLPTATADLFCSDNL